MRPADKMFMDLDKEPIKANVLPWDNASVHSIGDLHGNALKLLYSLVSRGAAKFPDNEEPTDQMWVDLGIPKPVAPTPNSFFQMFIEIYNKPISHWTDKPIDPKRMEVVTDLIDKKLQYAPKTGIRLMGDDLCDRGRSDGFTLLLIKKIDETKDENGKPVKNFTIIYSNHTAEFIRMMENSNTPEEFITALNNLRGTQESADGLKQMIKAGVIDFDEMKAIYKKHYLPNLKLFDYETVIDEDGQESLNLFSHAPTNEIDVLAVGALLLDDDLLSDADKKTIKTALKHAAKNGVTNNDIKELIRVINTALYKHAEKGDLTEKFIEKILDNPFECKIDGELIKLNFGDGYPDPFEPAHLTAWNRNDPIDNQVGTNIKLATNVNLTIHGHDDGNFTKCKTLDNPVGKGGPSPNKGEIPVHEGMKEDKGLTKKLQADLPEKDEVKEHLDSILDVANEIERVVRVNEDVSHSFEDKHLKALASYVVGLGKVERASMTAAIIRIANHAKSLKHPIDAKDINAGVIGIFRRDLMVLQSRLDELIDNNTKTPNNDVKGFFKELEEYTAKIDRLHVKLEFKEYINNLVAKFADATPGLDPSLRNVINGLIQKEDNSNLRKKMNAYFAAKLDYQEDPTKDGLKECNQALAALAKEFGDTYKDAVTAELVKDLEKPKDGPSIPVASSSSSSTAAPAKPVGKAPTKQVTTFKDDAGIKNFIQTVAGIDPSQDGDRLFWAVRSLTSVNKAMFALNSALTKTPVDTNECQQKLVELINVITTSPGQSIPSDHQLLKTNLTNKINTLIPTVAPVPPTTTTTTSPTTKVAAAAVSVIPSVSPTVSLTAKNPAAAVSVVPNPSPPAVYPLPSSAPASMTNPTGTTASVTPPATSSTSTSSAPPVTSPTAPTASTTPPQSKTSSTPVVSSSSPSVTPQQQQLQHQMASKTKENNLKANWKNLVNNKEISQAMYDKLMPSKYPPDPPFVGLVKKSDPATPNRDFVNVYDSNYPAVFNSNEDLRDQLNSVDIKMDLGSGPCSIKGRVENNQVIFVVCDASHPDPKTAPPVTEADLQAYKTKNPSSEGFSVDLMKNLGKMVKPTVDFHTEQDLQNQQKLQPKTSIK